LRLRTIALALRGPPLQPISSRPVGFCNTLMGEEIMPKEIFLAVLSLHFVLSIPVFAQTSNATLGGTVSDATGALIPGVSVTATNVATGIVQRF